MKEVEGWQMAYKTGENVIGKGRFTGKGRALSAGLNCRDQCRNGLFQRQGRAALFRQVGYVDKTDSRGAAVVVVQEGVEDVVTHKRTGGIGNGGGNVGISDGFGHFCHRNGCEIGGRSVGNYEFSPWLVACIVRDSGVTDVHSDSLWGHSAASAGLADAQNQIGLDFVGFLKNVFSGFAEYRRNAHFMDGIIADCIRKFGNGQPRRIHALAAKGIKTGNE